MKAERWNQIERIYHLAFALDKAKRVAFLEQICGNDQALKCEVQSLLEASEQNESFLERPPMTLAARLIALENVRLEGSLEESTASPNSTHGTIESNFLSPLNEPGLTLGERFEIRRCLGSGGFGIVYEAFDRREKARIALKTLHFVKPNAIYRLKHEFRALADISHPNLVNIYEMLCIDDRWLLTMELIEGVNFLEHVRSPSTANGLKAEVMDRIRPAFQQLAEGISALHLAGKLHCDLKPSNVLVESDGRVVILDFGLVTEFHALTPTKSNLVFGTPDYISPEQSNGDPPSPASDWYSFGVMLFEVLTGTRPFRGSAREILHRKQNTSMRMPAHLLIPAYHSDNCACCQNERIRGWRRRMRRSAWRA